MNTGRHSAPVHQLRSARLVPRSSRRGAGLTIPYETWTNVGLHEYPRAYLPGDKLVYGHIATMPRRQVRSELLAELAAMRDFNDDSVLAGREVNRLGVGDVVVLGDGTTWSLASIGVVAVEVSSADQINDGRSWTEVLDEEFANGIEPLSKPISELADDGWIWHPSQEACEKFA
ncbi:MAG: hypothetical protein AB7N61_20495 [Acidimicrobiia bacterium]